jgi:Carboxypeptidase regulatory-like domain/TonB-dependent Receptor Plug Domain
MIDVARRLFLFVLFVTCCSCTVLLAQESTVKGNLGGTVVDSTGAVVPQATVTATGPLDKRTVTTDSQGRFMFDLLTPGMYVVRAEQKGFKATEARNIEVLTNRTSRVQMSLQPGGVSETVEVSAASIGVDVASTKLETNLNDTFYSQLPIQRNVTGLFYAAAGVNEGGGTGAANPSIAGGSGLENQYVADGVNITDGAFGGIGVFSRNYGALATGINLSFVKEVDVKTGGYEPQYGKTTGGIVQIITKSGGSQFHGGISGFFAPAAFEIQHLNPDNTGRLNQQGVAVHQAEWDIAAELGGYVPGLRNHLFFFGSFNPAWNRLYDRFGDLHLVSGFTPLAQTTLPQISYDYATKLTYKINDKHVIETSLFGDPTRETSGSPNGPGSLALAAINTTGFSKLSNGTRNWALRYNGTLSPTWLVNASLSWGHNYLNETPSEPNVFQITDNTGSANPNDPNSALGALGTPLTGIYNRQGLGYFENTKGDNWGLSFDTQKLFNALGQHTISMGYHYDRNRYYGSRQATGGGFTVPDSLALNSGLPTGLTDYANTFELDPAANWGCTPNTPPSANAACSGVFYNVPGNGPTEVVLVQNRGFFSTPPFDSHGRYHAAYANDSWEIGRHITLNLGYRWEQEMLQGLKYTDPITGQSKQVHYTFTDNWSPRLGIAIDPLGDRKSKIYGNYARTSYAIPLDMAIRSLGNEEDAEFSFWQPPYISNGAPCSNINNPCQMAINPDGTLTPALDAAHVLGAFGAPPAFFYTSTQPGEAIARGTRMQYLEEYVAGIEHEFPHGIVVDIRFQHRRLARIVEDQSGVSPEAALLGINQQFEIGNPSGSSDLFTNTLEQVYPVGGLPPSCSVGGTVFNPYNTSQGLADVCILNPNTAGNPVPDGKPDGFVNPVRVYKAVEVEVSKSFSKGWQMRTNYRWSTLAGNYEGAFRNDNGQSDPSISSLFDFTPGLLNMLGDQFAIGWLNTDRRHIFNSFLSYTFSTGFLRNLTLGAGTRIEAGVPLNDLRAHPVYQNGGEVPLGGRGALGRTPTTGEGDLHVEYVTKVTEKHSIHFGTDLFNVANQKTQLRMDQFQDAALGIPNLDFKRPVGSGNVGVSPAYMRPFNARLFVKWQF